MAATLALTSTAVAGWNGSYWVDQTGPNRYVKTDKSSLVVLSQSSTMTPAWDGLSSNPEPRTGPGAAMDLLTWYGRTPAELASLSADMKDGAWRDSISVTDVCGTKDKVAAAVVSLGVTYVVCAGVVADFIRVTDKKGTIPLFMKDALTKWTPAGYVLREKAGASVLDIVQRVSDGNPVLVTVSTGRQWEYLWTVVNGVSGPTSALKLTFTHRTTMDAYGPGSYFSKVFSLEGLTQTPDAMAIAGRAFGLWKHHIFWYEKSAAGSTWGEHRTFSASGTFDAALSSCRSQVGTNNAYQVEAVYQTGTNSYACGYEHVACRPTTATFTFTDTGVKVTGLIPNSAFDWTAGWAGVQQASTAVRKADARGEFYQELPAYPADVKLTSSNQGCSGWVSLKARTPKLVASGATINISNLPVSGAFKLNTKYDGKVTSKTLTATASGTYAFKNERAPQYACTPTKPCQFQAVVLDKASAWLTHNDDVEPAYTPVSGATTTRSVPVR